MQGQLRQLALRSGGTKVVSEVLHISGKEHTCVKATKPSFATGAKASISSTPASTTTKPAIWKIDTGDEDDDLIAEDTLLTDEDRKPVAPASRGCPPTKKPCANCTCGRAEAEAAGVKVQLTQDMLDNPQSACGSVRCSILSAIWAMPLWINLAHELMFPVPGIGVLHLLPLLP
jgi:hypothetical protein